MLSKESRSVFSQTRQRWRTPYTRCAVDPFVQQPFAFLLCSVESLCVVDGVICVEDVVCVASGRIAERSKHGSKVEALVAYTSNSQAAAASDVRMEDFAAGVTGLLA